MRRAAGSGGPETDRGKEMTTIKTISQKTAETTRAYLRARAPLIWIVTGEEARAEAYLFQAALAAKYVPHTWDVAQGIANAGGKKEIENTEEPMVALDAIRGWGEGGKEPGVWIMRDLPVWMGGPAGAPILRRVRNLARLFPRLPLKSAQSLIVISPSGDIPPELKNHAVVIDWPLPDKAEIGELLDKAIAPYEGKIEPLNGKREAAIDAAVGLTGEEAQATFASSIVQLLKIDPTLIANEKKRVVARERVLEWYDPLPGGLDAVGGLENLKTWLKSRSNAYSPEARAYGLPAPKGAMLAGIPGCGKSLTAKAISTAWGVPLLRLDLGSVKSKFVGESEGNLRRALKVIEAIGRCVVWLDEIEKALQGATSGSADGGVSADALGAILNWMQERKGEAFVIATANDVESLPPELYRKGRFDELWWVDLPNTDERVAVLNAALRSNGLTGKGLDLKLVAKKCEGFSGAEIAALVPDAMYAGFADGKRPITTEDLRGAAETVTPLSKTASAKIERLRNWAKGKARLASAPAEETLDFGNLVQLDIA